MQFAVREPPYVGLCQTGNATKAMHYPLKGPVIFTHNYEPIDLEIEEKIAGLLGGKDFS